MEVPVCLEKRRVGTLAVTPSGADTVFRVRCTGLPAGLYRLYVCGDGGELLLGVTEDGCLHRRFSAAMTAPLGAVTWCRAQPAAAPQWRPATLSDSLPWHVPAGTLLRRQGAVTQLAAPWRQGEPFPLPELFCFAAVGRLAGVTRVFYGFSGSWTPAMPERGDGR